MVLLIIVLLLAMILAWLLFAPLRIRVNSWEDLYEVQAMGVTRITLVPTDDLFIIRFNVPFYAYTFDPLSSDRQKKKDRKPKERKKEGRKKRKPMNFRKIRKLTRLGRRLLGTFRIRSLNWVIDTGDMVTNARLVPVLLPFNRKNISLSTTFNGGGGIALDMDNRLSRILYQGFRVYVLNK